MTFEPDGIYSFTVYPSAILGTFKNVKVNGILNFDAAQNRGTDLIALHAQVYPTLPTGVPDDPRRYNYLDVQVNGTRKVIGIPWINSNDIVKVEIKDIHVIIKDQSTNEYDRILRVLSENGYTVSSIE